MNDMTFANVATRNSRSFEEAGDAAVLENSDKINPPLVLEVPARQVWAGADFFALNPVSSLRRWTDQQLWQSGRLLFPMIYDHPSDRFNAITWQEAFLIVARALRQVRVPRHVLFRNSCEVDKETESLVHVFADTFLRQVGQEHAQPKCVTTIDRPLEADALGLRVGRGASRRSPHKFNGYLFHVGNGARRVDRTMMLGGKLALAVHLGTDVHRGLLIPAETSVIFPALAREGGESPSVTHRIENWPFGPVELGPSHPPIPPYIVVKSEAEIIAAIASSTLDSFSTVSGSHAAKDHLTDEPASA